MRTFGGTISIAAFILAVFVVPAAAQQSSPSATINIFSDLNADGNQEVGVEPLIADWEIQLYDSDLTQLSALQSSDVQDDLYELAPTASFVCINPDTNWIQTAPANMQTHPDNNTWFCHSTDQDNALNFGVFPIDDDQQGELEENPELINQFPEKITPEPTEPAQGQVLGASDTAVLAETGSATSQIILIGLAIIALSINLSKRTKIYRK